MQEKLDTAEKLYLQVLRQREQQTQTVEYWQDLLAEQRDAEYEEDAFDEEDEDEAGGNKSKETMLTPPRDSDSGMLEHRKLKMSSIEPPRLLRSLERSETSFCAMPTTTRSAERAKRHPY